MGDSASYQPIDQQAQLRVQHTSQKFLLHALGPDGTLTTLAIFEEGHLVSALKDFDWWNFVVEKLKSHQDWPFPRKDFPDLVTWYNTDNHLDQP